MPTTLKSENNHPIMFFDGKSVSQPGVAAAAAVLLMNNGRRYTVSQFLSDATGLEAEYTGLIIGLQKAKQLGINQLDIKGDRSLIFEQIQQYKLEGEEKILSLHRQVHKLLRSFTQTNLECISEEMNRPAINAVNRCISEALGRKSQNSCPLVNPKVTQFLQLADTATEQDYKNLVLKDDFALMSLTDLILLVPEAIRDTIALQWDGNNQTLADIYRWYLRGLPPSMALKKAQIDHPSANTLSDEKLPWEDELMVPSGFRVPIETSDAFVDLSLSEDLAMTSFTFAEDESSEEVFFEFNHDFSKDTIPSEEKIEIVLEMVQALSDEERKELANQFIQMPEWVNVFFKAIATRLAKAEE